jgi:Replication protein C C-terminal region
MGREQAAIIFAIVSAKPAEHFRSTPGGYFHGMVAKAKTDELNLGRTIWGLTPSRRSEIAWRHPAAAVMTNPARCVSGEPVRRERSERRKPIRGISRRASCHGEPPFQGCLDQAAEAATGCDENGPFGHVGAPRLLVVYLSQMGVADAAAK